MRSKHQVAIKAIFMLFCGMVSAEKKGYAQEKPLTAKEYIEKYKEVAMEEMREYKIPASITLAQGLLESSSGNSKLAKECNNHFGIKCRKEWKGSFCLENDDAENECFRGYATARESYRDHSLFLRQNSRYGLLFTLSITDYKGWANGLRTAGYATNPAYGTILIGVIERHRLTQYDSMVLLGDDYVGYDSTAGKTIAYNGIPAVKARAGETPEDIAKKHEMGAWQIYKYNDLPKGADLSPGEIVYLKPKKRKGTVAEVELKEGEDLRSVSQQYGIKLKQVYKKNKIKPGQQVAAGEVLYLQKKREEAPKLATEVMGTMKEEVHEVKAGETLYGIAKRYGLKVDSLEVWNDIEGQPLKPGQRLVLKRPIKEVQEVEQKKEEEKVRPEKAEEVSYHIVKSGETLYRISKMYEKSVEELKKLNPGMGEVLKVGQKIRVR